VVIKWRLAYVCQFFQLLKIFTKSISFCVFCFLKTELHSEFGEKFFFLVFSVTQVRGVTRKKTAHSIVVYGLLLFGF